MPEEVMPLITEREVVNWCKEKNLKPYFLTPARNREAQRDADKKVLEAKLAWMKNAWRNYVEAREREWAKKEEEEWETLLRHLILLPETSALKRILYAAIRKHIAELNKIAEGTKMANAQPPDIDCFSSWVNPDGTPYRTPNKA